LGTQELIGPLASLLDFDSSAGLAVGEIPARALKWSLRVVVQATRALTNLFYEGPSHDTTRTHAQTIALMVLVGVMWRVAGGGLDVRQRARRSCSAKSSRVPRSRT
jgi:hypothetical protein